MSIFVPPLAMDSMPELDCTPSPPYTPAQLAAGADMKTQDYATEMDLWNKGDTK